MPTRSSSSIYVPKAGIEPTAIPARKGQSLLGAAGALAVRVADTVETDLRAAADQWMIDAVTRLRGAANDILVGNGEVQPGIGFAKRAAAEFDKTAAAIAKTKPPYANWDSAVAVVRRDFLEPAAVVEKAAVDRVASTLANTSVRVMREGAAVGFGDPFHMSGEGEAVVNALKLPPSERDAALAQARSIPLDHLRRLATEDPERALALLESDEVRARIPHAVLAGIRKDLLSETAGLEARKRASATANALKTRSAMDDVIRGVQDGKLPITALPLKPAGAKGAVWASLQKASDGARQAATARAKSLHEVANELERGKALNPNDPKHRKGIDALWDDHGHVLVQDLSGEQRARLEAQFADLAGIVPEALRRGWVLDLKSADPSRMAQAADAIGLLKHKDAQAGIDLDAEDRRLLDAIRGQLSVGTEGKAAAQAVLDGRGLSPDKRSAAERRFEAFLEGEDVARALDQAMSDERVRAEDLQSAVQQEPYDPSNPPAWDQAPYDKLRSNTEMTFMSRANGSSGNSSFFPGEGFSSEDEAARLHS